MENLGAHLQKLREGRGISYKKVFEDLRIREDQVKLIEENRWFELGPFGMVKALVFNYARYLEADVDEVMAELKVMMPEHTKKEFRSRPHEKQKKILLSTNFFWMIGILIVVVILGSILLYAHTRGWLKTPDLFKASAADTTIVKSEESETPMTDSLRLKMRLLSESINSGQEELENPAEPSTNALGDTTDYLGKILGNSPVNVPIH